MDKNLPLLLKHTLDNLLETHTIRNWKLVSGNNSTLVIHWDKEYGHHDTPATSDIALCPSVSAYKRKTPSQRRRDMRHSEKWRYQNAPDSGYKSSRRDNSLFLNDNNISVDKGCVNTAYTYHTSTVDSMPCPVNRDLLSSEVKKY